MSLLRPESRALTMESVWGSGGTVVTDVSSVPRALRLIPLYAAVMGIADDVSVAPWHVYRQTPGGWGERVDDPALFDDPAGSGAGFIPWMNQGVTSACLWGFAFAPILARAGRLGEPTLAPWVHPARVTIDESKTQPRFLLDGQKVDDYLYVPGPVLPGSIRGLSPVQLFRLQFGKALAAQQYAADTFARGIMPPGVFKNTARTIARSQAVQVRDQFVESVGGRQPLVTGNDWEWTPLAVPDDDAKFLDTIRAGATEIAAIYRVTPEDVGGVSGSSLTYSTLEMNQQNRNRRALLPWTRRFEDALGHALSGGVPGLYVKANLDALVRTDLKARMEAHDIALRIGMETQDEGRALEDKAPLTPDQVSAWQNLYGMRAGQQTSTTTVGGQA